EQSVGDAVDLHREQLDPDVAKLGPTTGTQLSEHGLQVTERLFSGDLPALNIERPQARLAAEVVAVGIEPVNDGEPLLLGLPALPQTLPQPGRKRPRDESTEFCAGRQTPDRIEPAVVVVLVGDSEFVWLRHSTPRRTVIRARRTPHQGSILR